MADLGELRDLLVYEGQAALTRQREPVAFTGNPAGDELLNDLVKLSGRLPIRLLGGSSGAR